MKIHTVKPGDTVFKIAREHGVSPLKIIENNELENPDRLVVGQKLLILIPTRTYNVRGSDTLERIADRFGVSRKSLRAKNPYLAGTDKMYPGQLLAIKYDTPRYGLACANGYCYRGVNMDRLSLVAPYLTYLTVGAGVREGDEVKLTFDDTEPLEFARENGITPLFRVYDRGHDFSDEYINNLLLMAKAHGYGGITLAAYAAAKAEPKKFEDSLRRLKKMLTEYGMSLFLEVDGNSEITVADIADSHIIMYEKCPLEKIPTFDEGERRVMSNFAERYGGRGAYMDIATLGYMGDEEITKADFERLAHSSGKEILCDSERGICYFEYNKYKNGKKETVRASFEDLENIKSKLALAGELGFMGISFDIMNVPVEYLMMLEAMFSRPES